MRVSELLSYLSYGYAMAAGGVTPNSGSSIRFCC